MKTKLFATLLFVMLSFQLSQSQTYQSLFGEKSTYYTFIGYSEMGTPFVVKDTIIENQVYKTMPSGNFIRITPDNSKAFLRPKNDNEHSFNNSEYLVMDLTLKVGDIFSISDTITYLPNGSKMGGYDKFIVDSVYVLDGLKHIRFNQTFNFYSNAISVDYKFEFIEGIGSSLGVEFRPCLIEHLSFGGQSPVLCAFKDNIGFYTTNILKATPDEGKCLISLGIKETMQNKSVVVEFNQKNKQLNVKAVNGDMEQYAIEIYNTSGKLVKSLSDVSLPTIIQMTTQSKGVYLVKCSSEKRVVNKKIIVL